MEKDINGFLNELDLISRKYGIWIEVDDPESVYLVDANFDKLTNNFYNDEESQEYVSE